MNELAEIKEFQTVEHRVIGEKDKIYFEYSAICDEDGTFTISCSGNGGVSGLLKFVKELNDIAI